MHTETLQDAVPIAVAENVSGLSRTWDNVARRVLTNLQAAAKPLKACLCHWNPRPASGAAGLSLSSRGARIHFDIAMALISIIPMLALTYILYLHPSTMIKGAVSFFAFTSCLIGYWVLSCYPRTLLRMLDYLQHVANGDMPEVATLMEKEKDIADIERYLNMILQDLRGKIRTIGQQRDQIRSMERQKAISESMATACHHIGQPATVIVAYLDLIGQRSHSPDVQRMVKECQVAGESISIILRALNEAASCGSEAYLTDGDPNGLRAGNSLLSLHGLPVHPTTSATKHAA